MADPIPAKLKGLQLATFVKRAAQLERFKPIVAYWINFYIVQRIISGGLHAADEECTAYTTKLMEKLEQAKADNPNEDAILDETAAAAYCEQFALTTFAKGEKDMAENRANSSTADTLLAASTFLEVLSIWKKNSDPEITAKTKFAKYHALRILKAIKAGEDPNLTNPVQDTQQPIDPPALDPSDPEVQQINQGATPQPQDSFAHNPYQSYVETAPNTDAQPSPLYSAAKVSPPPPDFPADLTGYTHSSHNDVSPISQPGSSRKGSVTSVGGGYFPRMDPPPPTFTAETTAPALPTAPSMDENPLTSSLPTSPQPPLAPNTSNNPSASDPASFYQNTAAPPQQTQAPSAPPPPMQSPPPQMPHQPPVSVGPSQPQQGPPASQQPPVYQSPGFQPPTLQSTSPAPLPTQYQYTAPAPQPRQSAQAPQRGAVGVLPAPNQEQPSYSSSSYQNPFAGRSAPSEPPLPPQGTFRTDEDSISDAQKHAKWAMSALNFDDVPTAVKELRIALRSLGAY